MASSCIKIRVTKSLFEISPCGEVDAFNATLLEEAIWLTGTYPRPNTYLNFAKLAYLSTEGLGEIVSSIRGLEVFAGQVRIGQCPPEIADTLRQLGLGEIIYNKILPEQEAAPDGLWGLIVGSDLEELSSIRSYVEEVFAHMDTPRDQYYGLMMAVDELCSNVMRHNYDGERCGPLAVIVSKEGGVLEISVIDKGFRFDPTEHNSRPVAQTVESGRAGGLGIPLISMLTDKATFSHQEGHNIMQLSKEVPASKGTPSAIKRV